MQTHFRVTGSFLFLSMLLLSPFSTHAEDQQSNQGQDKQLKGAVIIPPKDRLGDVSPGAVEDALKACLARIPENASVGQRILAELTCQREEETRKAYQRAPHF
jgi:hypothetical protein